MCAQRHRAWTPPFEQHGVRLALAGDYAGEVPAVPGAIEQILDDLLCNALRVAPTGSTVSIDLRRHAPHERRFPHRPTGPARWTCTSWTRARV